MSTTVLILGDVHLGKSLAMGKSGIGAALNSRIVDQFNILDWVLDQAIEQNTSDIIITGDIFEDPKPQTELITGLISWINKCSDYNVKIHIIIGNHDILRTGYYVATPLDIIAEASLPNCSIYKEINTITIRTTAFTLMPFRDRKSFITDSNENALVQLADQISYELSSIPLPYTKVVIGHFALEGSIPVGDEIDDISNELFCSVKMFQGYDYVWMGHVHKPQILQKNPLVCHIGSMDLSNFGESNQKKHIVIFDLEEKSHEKIIIPTRNLTKLSVLVPKDTEDTTQYVLDHIKDLDLKQSIVKLEVNLEDSNLKSMNRNLIEKFLYKEGAFNVAGFTESKKISLVKKQEIEEETIDSNLEVPEAMKMWAKKKHEDEEKLNKLISAGIAIFNDYKAGAKS